jgi:hypothetical protein
MQNKTDTVQQFEKFAEAMLKNHVAELNTRYGNEKVDKQIIQQAWWEHQKIYDEELDEKIKSLLSAESNSQLKGELENVKHAYLISNQFIEDRPCLCFLTI